MKGQTITDFVNRGCVCDGCGRQLADAAAVDNGSLRVIALKDHPVPGKHAVKNCLSEARTIQPSDEFPSPADLREIVKGVKEQRAFADKLSAARHPAHFDVVDDLRSAERYLDDAERRAREVLADLTKLPTGREARIALHNARQALERAGERAREHAARGEVADRQRNLDRIANEERLRVSPLPADDGKRYEIVAFGYGAGVKLRDLDGVMKPIHGTLFRKYPPPDPNYAIYEVSAKGEKRLVWDPSGGVETVLRRLST